MSGKFIDPVEHIRRTADESLGVVPQREIVRRQESGERFDADSQRTQRLITFETLELHLPNPPASATTTMFHLIATGATTMGLSGINADIAQQCRVVNFRLMVNALVTAGTVTPEIVVFEGADTTIYVISQCELNTTDDHGKSTGFEWESAFQLSKGAQWAVSLVTSAAYAPVTIDFKALVTLAYEHWIPS